VVQTVAFKSHPYAGGTNSCFVKPLLHWRYKQLLSEAIPYAVVVQSLDFQVN